MITGVAPLLITLVYNDVEQDARVQRLCSIAEAGGMRVCVIAKSSVTHPSGTVRNLSSDVKVVHVDDTALRPPSTNAILAAAFSLLWRSSKVRAKRVRRKALYASDRTFFERPTCWRDIP